MNYFSHDLSNWTFSFSYRTWKPPRNYFLARNNTPAPAFRPGTNYLRRRCAWAVRRTCPTGCPWTRRRDAASGNCSRPYLAANSSTWRRALRKINPTSIFNQNCHYRDINSPFAQSIMTKLTSYWRSKLKTAMIILRKILLKKRSKWLQ